MPQAGIEPTTLALGVPYSVHLSYWGVRVQIITLISKTDPPAFALAGCAILPVMRTRSMLRSFLFLPVFMLIASFLAGCDARPDEVLCYQESCIQNLYVTNSQGLITIWLDMVDPAGMPITTCPQAEFTGRAEGLRNPEGDASVSNPEELLFKCGPDTLLVDTLPFSAGQKRSTLVDITGLLQAHEDAGRVFQIEVNLAGVDGWALSYEYVAPKENEMNRAGLLAAAPQITP